MEEKTIYHCTHSIITMAMIDALEKDILHYNILYPEQQNIVCAIFYIRSAKLLLSFNYSQHLEKIKQVLQLINSLYVNAQLIISQFRDHKIRECEYAYEIMYQVLDCFDIELKYYDSLYSNKRSIVQSMYNVQSMRSILTFKLIEEIKIIRPISTLHNRVIIVFEKLQKGEIPELDYVK